jgi:hypothetical protein
MSAVGMLTAVKESRKYIIFYFKLQLQSFDKVTNIWAKFSFKSKFKQI